MAVRSATRNRKSRFRKNQQKHICIKKSTHKQIDTSKINSETNGKQINAQSNRPFPRAGAQTLTMTTAAGDDDGGHRCIHLSKQMKSFWLKDQNIAASGRALSVHCWQQGETADWNRHSVSLSLPSRGSRQHSVLPAASSPQVENVYLRKQLLSYRRLHQNARSLACEGNRLGREQQRGIEGINKTVSGVVGQPRGFLPQRSPKKPLTGGLQGSMPRNTKRGLRNLETMKR
jgi:hypothetical protein